MNSEGREKYSTNLEEPAKAAACVKGTVGDAVVRSLSELSTVLGIRRPFCVEVLQTLFVVSVHNAWAEPCDNDCALGVN
jgi:hypothetical protein